MMRQGFPVSSSRPRWSGRKPARAHARIARLLSLSGSAVTSVQPGRNVGSAIRRLGGNQVTRARSSKASAAREADWEVDADERGDDGAGSEGLWGMATG